MSGISSGDTCDNCEKTRAKSQETSVWVGVCDRYTSDIADLKKQLLKTRTELCCLRQGEWEDKFNKLTVEMANRKADYLSQIEQINELMCRRDLAIKRCDVELRELMEDAGNLA